MQSDRMISTVTAIPGSASVVRAPLHTLLGDYPTTRALRRGALTSPLVPLSFADVAVPNKAFKRVVRDLEFDVAELALMTFLMARSRGVPLRLLPVVVFSRNPLPHLVCDRDRCRVTPRDLPGLRIGVRAYTTTTAVWVRALLADQFGVEFGRVEWVTLEDGHVAGVADPPSVRRDTSGADLLTMLRDGVVDAIIVDPVPAEARFVPVVRDPEATFLTWQHERGAHTINHVVAVKDSLADDEQVMRELFRLFRDSWQMAGVAVEPRSVPLGFASNRVNLQVAIAVADEQRLLGGPLTVNDLVTPVLASLE